MKIKGTITIWIIVIELFFSILYSYYLIGDLKRVENQKLNRKILVNRQMIKEIYPSFIWEIDAERIEKITESFYNKPEIVGIIVQDKFKIINVKKGIIKRDKENIFEKIVLKKEGIDIGNIEVIYTNSEINRSLKNLKMNLIVFGLNLIILVTIMLKMLKKVLIKPIKEIIKGLIIVNKGKYNHKISINGNNEFKSIENYFNQMTNKISDEIRKRKVKEKELEKINRELENRVANRTLDLEKTIENLEKTKNEMVRMEKMASLGNLVAGISHEINTPIGIGVTAASFLEENVENINMIYKKGKMKKTDLEDHLKITVESSQLILSNLKKASNLIKSFKEIAVDQSSEEIRKINLKIYLEEILVSLHPKLKKTKHKVKVNCSEDINIKTYPGILYQIISNFIINSLVHGFENKDEGEILIEISKENQIIELIYSDNGKGVSDENLNKIFEPFFTTKRGNGGSGLGLNITYNLVTVKLKGAIECQSQVGKGVKFIVSFPEIKK